MLQIHATLRLDIRKRKWQLTKGHRKYKLKASKNKLQPYFPIPQMNINRTHYEELHSQYTDQSITKNKTNLLLPKIRTCKPNVVMNHKIQR